MKPEITPKKTEPAIAATAHPIINGRHNKSLQTTPQVWGFPFLDQLTSNAKEFLSHLTLKPEETAITGIQHLRGATLNLFEKFKDLGFEVYVTGQYFSTNPATYKAMQNMGIHAWAGSKPKEIGDYQAVCKSDITVMCNTIDLSKKIKNIIIIDDSGRFYANMPIHFHQNYSIGIIEQNQTVFYNANQHVSSDIPVVNVAQSAVRTLFTSKFAAQVVVENSMKFMNNLDKKRCIIGIIGLNAIGQALTDRLLQDGFLVCIFDENENSYQNYNNLNKVKIMFSLERLFTYTNFIINCTQQDVTQSFNPLTLTNNNRYLMSLSIADNAFNTLLKNIANENKIIYLDPLSTFCCYTRNKTELEVIYGGYPANFSNVDNLTSDYYKSQIFIETGILIGAAMQLIELMENKNKSEKIEDAVYTMLNPKLQQKIIEMWCQINTNKEIVASDLVKEFITNVNFVIKHSQGKLTNSAMENIIAPISRYNARL